MIDYGDKNPFTLTFAETLNALQKTLGEYIPPSTAQDADTRTVATALARLTDIVTALVIASGKTNVVLYDYLEHGDKEMS